jgi:hypothetical protein
MGTADQARRPLIALSTRFAVAPDDYVPSVRSCTDDPHLLRPWAWHPCEALGGTGVGIDAHETGRASCTTVAPGAPFHLVLPGPGGEPFFDHRLPWNVSRATDDSFADGGLLGQKPATVSFEIDWRGGSAAKAIGDGRAVLDN